MSLVGLSGSHRVGKSTLAREYAKRHGLEFIQTSASAVFKELGLDPAAPLDFKTRLMVQEKVLEALDAQFRSAPLNKMLITDRTPLDMIAYTMSECHGNAVAPEDQARLASYIARCFEVCNKRFSTIFVIQPGIELVHEEGKAALNQAYIEQLNTLILGLTVGGRLKSEHFYVPRSYTDLEDRMSALEAALKAVNRRMAETMLKHQEAGTQVH